MTDAPSLTEQQHAALEQQCVLVTLAVNSAFQLAPEMLPVAEAMLSVLQGQDRARGPAISFDGFEAVISYQDGSPPLRIDCHPAAPSAAGEAGALN